MPFTVAVLDEIGFGGLSSERATELAAAAFAARGYDPERMGEVSVALVDRETIQGLNLQYRGKDSPTDVLSFGIDGPYGEMVGEIVICPSVSSSEMPIEELVVHGALHLSGMDHGEDFEESEMAAVQGAVLRDVGGGG